MPIKVLLITPPFTQLNTPYPATAYLKAFLNEKGVQTDQCDLSIELFNVIFSKDFISKMFDEISSLDTYSLASVWQQKEDYISKVDTIIYFLKNPEVTIAYQILRPGFLPEAHRRTDMDEDLNWAFGNLGILDKAKHYGTLFIEELGDFIQANIDEFFAFTKYAEQIASSASSYDKIDEFLGYDTTLIEVHLIELMDAKISEYNPDLVGFSIPFPGNLFSALRCAQFIKYRYPNIKIAFGGGYCNTELRSIYDTRIFKYVDFICLDDGEGPLYRIAQFLGDEIGIQELERTFVLENGHVVYKNKMPNTIFHHSKLPTPNYAGLKHDQYISFLDVMNPMHRIWSDGRWNKMTISHGCYWKQCSFCDVNLPYIGDYQNTTADDLVNKIVEIMSETGISGFHFVDEAAPPKILKALAEKLIEHKIFITWWTNIRFEKTFTNDLCALLSRSGCIAITGGLEVASDRLLVKMKKGVSIEKVSRITNAFAENGIMVHAYLMYGFPTQTDQETIDALEVVRQLFMNGCIHSAYWHKFTTTIHSPIGKDPASFGIEIIGPKFKGFAQNDLIHEDPTGADHEKYTVGLNDALSHYLNGDGLELNLQEWFDFTITPTILHEDTIASYLKDDTN